MVKEGNERSGERGCDRVGERGVNGRVQRSTPDLLRNLRNSRVMVFHPRDSDGELLVQQLQRIGCQVLTMWPPLPELPESVDVLFCAVQPDQAAVSCTWMGAETAIPVIAIINYENPTVVDAALRMGAVAVLVSPVRSAGILSTLAMAKHAHAERRELSRRALRLEQKLASVNTVSEAKAILVRTRQVTDSEAYRVMREQAMSKRVPVEEIAQAIIHADGILSFPARS